LPSERDLPIDDVVDHQLGNLAIQKRIVGDMREIWMLQPRFEKRMGASPFRLLDHLRYRAGYDFLLLRIDAGQADAELGQWWTDFADGSNDERQELIKAVAKQPGQAGAKKRRRRRSPRKSGEDGQDMSEETAGPGHES